MSRRSQATWVTRYGVLLAEARAPRRVLAMLGYAVPALILGALTVLVLNHAAPTFFTEGPTAPVRSRRGTVPAWLPFSVGILMAAVFVGGVVASLFSSRPKVVLVRLTPDTLSVLTAEGVENVPWSDVRDVRAERVDGRDRMVVDGSAGSLMMADAAAAYPVTAVVHHFWRNPSDRPGLGRRGGGRTTDRVLGAVESVEVAR
ncbi:hypothetical protein FE697_003790 [Mumia zhuanghuii]|uniref:PH domain-containing protein n=2 Tax=Mumia TaxID=1546255 RepID=A0ABW1QMX5_9ACTN|nr:MULTISPECIES: hypothetical protein [Mumia]KAA1425024.1 hypothetical protein FE697_003790 [Mumia zhuanghuii]